MVSVVIFTLTIFWRVSKPNSGLCCIEALFIFKGSTQRKKIFDNKYKHYVVKKKKPNQKIHHHTKKNPNWFIALALHFPCIENEEVVASRKIKTGFSL